MQIFQQGVSSGPDSSRDHFDTSAGPAIHKERSTRPLAYLVTNEPILLSGYC